MYINKFATLECEYILYIYIYIYIYIMYIYIDIYKGIHMVMTAGQGFTELIKTND